MPHVDIEKKLELHRKWLRGDGGERADLTRANLTDADLTGANLTRANLTDADLTGANLTGADLTRANLTGANLTGARGWLKQVRDDVWKVLSWAPNEAPAVLTAIEEGRVNGSVYAGECACLVGTIAQARGIDPHSVPNRDVAAAGELACDSSSPAEQFFMRILPGHTPDFSVDAALAAGWVREFMQKQPVAGATTTTEG